MVVFGIKEIMEEDILNYLPTVMFREILSYALYIYIYILQSSVPGVQDKFNSSTLHTQF